MSPYEATIINFIREAGGVVAGKTNLDEFGMGSHSAHSAFGSVKTLKGRSPGGSSGGSAVAVATRQCDSALGTDTGGSVRLPAAYNGIYGFKPSYGLVSRWGVVAYANSLDTVGFFAQSMHGLRKLFEVCNVFDSRDPTCLSQITRERIETSVSARPLRNRKLHIGFPLEYNTQSLTPAIRETWSQTLRSLQSMGHTIHSISLPSTAQALAAYYVIAPAEASSNLAKYDSVRYGTRPPPATKTDIGPQHPDTPLYACARHFGLGREVRRRILLGAYSLSAAAIDNYFIQAQRVRRCVQLEFDQVFSLSNPLRDDGRRSEDAKSDDGAGVDVIVCPTAPTLPPTLDEVEAQGPLDAYAADVFTVPASLAGLPAISVPVPRAFDVQATEKSDVTTVGMQIIGQYGSDNLVLDLAEELEAQGICRVEELEGDVSG